MQDEITVALVTNSLQRFGGSDTQGKQSIGVIDYLFTSVEEDRLVAYAPPANERSVRTLENVGFQSTGRKVRDGGKHLCNLYELSVSKWTERRTRIRGV
jgi:hypothetical protein